MAQISWLRVFFSAALFFCCAAVVLPSASIAQKPSSRPIVIRPLAPAAQSLLTKWTGVLAPSAKAKISEVASLIGGQLRNSASSTDPVQLARSMAASHFPNTPPNGVQAAALLIMMTVSNTAAQDMQHLMDQIEQRKHQKTLNGASLTDMNSQDELTLQQLMDKRSQLESMISNIMKATSDTQGAIVGNLK